MIKLLDKATIDKIAAGEVIERPSSVIKELVENSIDAGATSITIEIKEGGISFMRVTDNGCGIPKDQVKTAYMRHATSKIEDIQDLYSITSLGFRGEALSTIAAVGQTEMITKTSDELTGIKYVIHGGEEIEYSEVGVPNGTTIVVRNLFFNTPARKKFLKSPATEASYINDLVLKIALSHPEISIKLIVNGQTKLDTAGSGQIKDTIYQLFGRDITNNLISVSSGNDNIKISGYIGKPFISRGNRSLENYFINKRYIKSSIVNRAIEEGYRTFVMQHKFPFTVLFIELPPEKCDVNIHPTKMEFKYDNEYEMFETVSNAVKNALTHREAIPKVVEKSQPQNTTPNEKVRPVEPYEQIRQSVSSTEKQTSIPSPSYKTSSYNPTYKILEKLKQEDQNKNNEINETEKKAVIYESSNTALKSTNENTLKEDESISYLPKQAANHKLNVYMENTKPVETTGKQQNLFDDNFLSVEAKKKHRLIGQVFGTFWLIEYEKNLYIMDQHAAHEKVKFEELMSGLKSNEALSQQLMPPLIITVSYAERQAVLDNFDLFFKVGFEIEEFGGNEFKINAVPSNLYGLEGRDMIMGFIGDLINNSGYMSNEIFVRKLASMACKAAIKGNTKITFEEADALIEQLLKLDNPYTCPHGRPTIISISEAELEKKFKRIV